MAHVLPIAKRSYLTMWRSGSGLSLLVLKVA
nr:MAG TPA: hypothetical protein [Caudoviricetes sp.]